jgi:superfamily II DNA or RNA helicase
MKLWTDQMTAALLLQARQAYGLWWEPGCGKTAPLAAAGRMVGGRQLWLTRAALRLQAAREIRKFRGDDVPIQVITEKRAWVDPRAHVVICSYEMARTVPIMRQFHRRAWQSLVLDEAHSLASPGAVTTQAIYGHKPTSNSLIRLVPHVWPATGTLIINYPHELWTHVSRLWPHLCADCPSYQQWKDRYCIEANNGYGMAVVGGQNLEELRQKMAETGWRMKLAEARDVPPLVVDEWPLDGEVDLSGIDPEVLAMVEEACGVDTDLEGLGMPAATLRRLLALGKAKAFAARVALEMESGVDRMVVFGCHIEGLQQAAQILRPFGARLIIGATPTRERNEAVDAYDRGDCPILVGHVQALGTGLNLQAGRRVAFLDASWSPAQNAQAIGRCYRAGQTRPVLASYSSLAGTIDEAVQAALTRKARVLRKLEGTD